MHSQSDCAGGYIILPFYWPGKSLVLTAASVSTQASLEGKE